MRKPAQRGSILCVGRLYCDLIFTDVPQFPAMGTEVFANGFGLHAGGGAGITAAHLSHLGHRVGLSAFLPSAPFHDIVRKDLTRAGLDLTLCQVQSIGSDPQLTVAISDNSDRAFLTRRCGAAFPDISVDDLRRMAITHVHIGELATLVEKPEIVRKARAIGATLSLDCGWDDSLTTRDVSLALKDIDLFLPNEAEAKRLNEMGVKGPSQGLTVVKQGAKGATAYTGTSQINDPAASVNVVDTTGAGDAFNAGFLSAWLDGKQLSECLQAGNLQGAKAITQVGGFQYSGALDGREGSSVEAKSA